MVGAAPTGMVALGDGVAINVTMGSKCHKMKICILAKLGCVLNINIEFHLVDPCIQKGVT